MSRYSRRIGVRLKRLTLGVVCVGLVAHRWGLRRSAVSPAPESEQHPPTRGERVQRLTASAATEKMVWDVLVVGGGVTGLYTAIEAAQRGLRVALVEAQDIGSGFTSHAPGLAPGPIPYLQRALRQRENAWLAEAMRTLRRQRVWYNVTQLLDDHAETLATSGFQYGYSVAVMEPHFTGVLELRAMGLLGTLLSPFFGFGQMHFRELSQRRLLAAGVGGAVVPLPSMREGPQPLEDYVEPLRGAVISRDVLLDGSRLAVRLACTAERLGVTLVTYAPLCDLALVDATASPLSPAPDTNPPKEVLFKATITDEIGLSEQPPRTLYGSTSASAHRYDIYARSVANCTGAWVDAVRQLLPENAEDPLPSVFDPELAFQVRSFLVAPRSAVQPIGVTSLAAGQTSSGASSLLDTLHVDGLHAVPLKFAFTSALVLPWVNECVLLGPSCSALRHLPALNKPSSSDSHRLLLQSAEGYRTATDRILEALHCAGVRVDRSQLLSCLSSWTPSLRPPAEVPWLSDFIFKNYFIAVSRRLKSTAELEQRQKTLEVARGPPASSQSPLMAAVRSTPRESDVTRVWRPEALSETSAFPFAHAYGGVPLQARDMAEELVDTLVQTSPTLQKKADAHAVQQTPWWTWWQPSNFYARRTERLGLSALPWSAVPGREVEAVEAMCREGYAERVTDVLFRRLSIGYTSPGQAAAVAPQVAAVMAKILGWNAKRESEEVRRALGEISTFSVRQ